MNATVDQFKERVNGIEGDQEFVNLIKDTMQTIKAQESEQWRAEQWEKLDTAKQTVLDGWRSAKGWTTEKYNTASQAISDWFEEMKNKMSVAWEEFKESAGQKWENFKDAMKQFGEKIAEMWGKAMESLGKLWDEMKIGAHNVFVDTKTAMQNLCTDMSCGAANLGIAVQKGVLAMDDAFQQVKGSVSQVVADKFQDNAGKLLVESELAYQDALTTMDKFEAMKFTGQDNKTIISAQKYQETVMDEMRENHEKLTETIKSRENLRDTFQNIKDGTTQKMETNKGVRDDLNAKSQLNTGKKQAIKIERSDKAKGEKSSYADKVRGERSGQNTGQGRGGL